MAIEVGKIYTVNHIQRGIFDIRVEVVDLNSIVGIIVRGVAQMWGTNGFLTVGDWVTVSLDFCTLTETP